MREGSKESQVLIGNIHVHKDNTYGVSMMSDRTIDNKSDEASARSRGISIYAADSKGMTKVNASESVATSSWSMSTGRPM